MKTAVAIQPLCDDLPLPRYATNGSAGMDLMACVDQAVVLPAGERLLVPCGFSMALPEGLVAQICSRSGLALKKGITVLNAPGTIDSDYRGEIGVILHNTSSRDFTINRGDRIAQMIIASFIQAVWQIQNLTENTERGQGGFGSTGTKSNLQV